MLAEKYRPKRFDEIVGHNEEKKILKKLAQENNGGAIWIEGNSGMACAKCGIELPLENTARYIAGWLKFLKEDFTFLPRALLQAGKAIDYIFSNYNAKKKEKF